MKAKERELAFVLGLPFHVSTMDQAIEDAVIHIESRKPGYFITANADFIAQAYENETLKDILFHADRVVCDGMPLVWLSRIFKPRLPERVTGADMVFRLFEEADKRSWKVFFLGSDEDTLSKTKSILGDQYPKMKIVGTISPPFGTIESWPNTEILKDIKNTQPDLLLVAVGCPKQEYWISKYKDESRIPLSIGIGASLDFICGKQIRAPKIVQRIGMEWMWRLLTNPTRLFKRYSKDLYYILLLGYRQWKLTREPSKLTELSEVKIGKKCECCESLGVSEIIWSGSVERSSISDLAQPEDYKNAVFLNLKNVLFIDSSGIGELAKIARKCRQEQVPFAVLEPSDVVFNVIKNMHLETQFPCFESCEDAVENFRKEIEI